MGLEAGAEEASCAIPGFGRAPVIQIQSFA